MFQSEASSTLRGAKQKDRKDQTGRQPSERPYDISHGERQDDRHEDREDADRDDRQRPRR
jgi:hypothetical protein